MKSSTVMMQKHGCFDRTLLLYYTTVSRYSIQLPIISSYCMFAYKAFTCKVTSNYSCQTVLYIIPKCSGLQLDKIVQVKYWA